MRGVLIGISEAVQGQAYPLEQSEIPIGRGVESAVQIPHRSVSRNHCVIRVHETHAEIQDQSSHNGTFVNGLPVHDRVLCDGDEITVGSVAFLFRIVEPQAIAPAAPAAAASFLDATALELNAPLAREAATLSRISEVARVVQQLYLERAAPDTKPAARQLFEAIFEIIPSQAGALMLLQGSDGLVPLAEFAYTGPPGPILSPEPMRRVRDSRGPVSGIHDGIAWIASPLLISGRSTGTLCLDARGSRRDYGTSDLQMIAAVADVLALAIENARDLEMLRAEITSLRADTTGSHTPLIGESRAMTSLNARILKVARTNSTVMIRGESGTGKELVAQAIHRNSPRSTRPFIAVNCAAIPGTLLESEFFGHEKGAFSGAVMQRKGRFEIAEGGTVFLDEIGELEPSLQAKLLRVLQEHAFERVGGSRPVKVDIRVIAATARDLEKAIREGTFRDDLYYRLSVVPLHVPPLRERREDIPLLASYFVHRYSEEVGRKVSGLSREARALLMAWDWPGNVRELQNVIERAVVMGSSEVIIPDDLPEALFDAAPAGVDHEEGFHASVRQHRRRLILAAVERAGGNVAEAARHLKLHPAYLHRLITSLGLREPL